MEIDQKALQQKLKQTQKEAFEQWLEQPMTRVGLSMIPSGEHRDTLRMLLASAFEQGFGSGSLACMMEILTRLMDEK